MAHQTLKRQSEDLNPNNDNLKDDKHDITMGGKRFRYIYSYTLQSDLENTNDSDETESVHSIQSKSTIQIISEVDLPSSNDSNSTTSNTSTTLDYMVTSNDSLICDKTEIDSDNGREDSDVQAKIKRQKKKLSPPAYFKNCLQCLQENPNPYFQYCFKCFQNRMEYFESKPNQKRKKTKRLNLSYCPTEGNSIKGSQESSSLNSASIGISSVHLFQKQNNNSNKKNIDTHSSEIIGTIGNICNICLTLPKNGIFNHGKIGHIYCCYPCTKKIRKKTNKCPICNVKVNSVTKMIIV